MKKSLFVVIAMVAFAVMCITAVAEEYIPIRQGIEVMPMRSEATTIANEVCWQVVYDPGRKILRRQIFPINGANESAITQHMKDRLMAIAPAITSSEDWRPYGFTCKPAGWAGEEIVKTEENKSPVEEITAPDPNADLQDKLDALKAELDAAEAAEAKPAATAPAVVAKAPVKKVKKPAAFCCTGDYMKKLARLGYSGPNAVSDFQASAKIPADGKIGPQTARAIDRAIAAMEKCAADKIGDKACADKVITGAKK